MRDWFDEMYIGPPLWHSHGISLENTLMGAAIPLAIEAVQLLVTLEANAPAAIALGQTVADMLRSGTVTDEQAASIRAQLDAVHAAIDAV